MNHLYMRKMGGRGLLFIFIIAAFFFFGLPAFSRGRGIDVRRVTLLVYVEPHFSLIAEGDLNFTAADIKRGQAVRKTEVRVATNLGRPYEVFLSAPAYPADEKGRVLPATIKFKVAEARKGKAEVPAFLPLSKEERLIYTSNPDGEGETFTVIFYFPQPPGMIPAGRFRAAINYRVVVK